MPMLSAERVSRQLWDNVSDNAFSACSVALKIERRQLNLMVS